jgi:hypothetical protein
LPLKTHHHFEQLDAQKISHSGYREGGERIPGAHKKRAVVRAIRGIERRRDAARGHAGEAARDARILRRALPQYDQQAGERADREKRRQAFLVAKSRST